MFRALDERCLVVSTESIVKAREQEFRKKALDQFSRSVPKKYSCKDFDEVLKNRWQGTITSVSRKRIEKYLRQPTSFLVLHGGVGLGKTIMAVEIAKRLIENRHVYSALYISNSRLMNQLSFGADDGKNVVDRMCKPDVLVLDDIGSGSVDLTPTRKNGLWAIVNQRWSDGKITIITTNLPVNPDDGDELNMTLPELVGESAWDRIVEGSCAIEFKGKSMRQNPR